MKQYDLSCVGIKGDLKITLEGEGKDDILRVIKDAVSDASNQNLTVEVLTYNSKIKLRICDKKNFSNIFCKTCEMRLTSFADDYTLSTCSSCLKQTRSNKK